MEVDRTRTPGPACAVRAQRDEIRLCSIRAIPTSHNASPGDITKTTPPGAPGADSRSSPVVWCSVKPLGVVLFRSGGDGGAQGGSGRGRVRGW